MGRLVFSCFVMADSNHGIVLHSNNGRIDLNKKSISDQIPETVEAFAWTIVVCDHRYIMPIPYADNDGAFAEIYLNCLRMVRRCRQDANNKRLESDAMTVSS